MTTQARSLERRILVASAASCAVGFTTIFVQPILFFEIMSRAGLSESSTGVVLSVEMLAVSVSSGLCSRLCKNSSFVSVAVAGTVIAALANAISIVSSSYSSLLAARFLCGLGEGSALMVASVAPARFANPDRAYAIINAFTVIIGTLAVYVAPWVGRVTGGPMAFPTMLAIFTALIPAIVLMPRSERFAGAGVVSANVEAKTESGSLVALCSSFFVLITVNSAIFALSAILGRQAGLSEQAVNDAIAVAIMCSLVGSLVAGIIGVRFGRWLPMAVGVTAITVALYVMCTVHTPKSFRSTAAIQMMGDYFIFPYILGSAAELDRTGRGVAAANAAVPLSYAVGPFLGGVLLQYFGFGTLAWLAVILNTVAYTVWFWATQNPRRIVQRTASPGSRGIDL